MWRRKDKLSFTLIQVLFKCYLPWFTTITKSNYEAWARKRSVIVAQYRLNFGPLSLIICCSIRMWIHCQVGESASSFCCEHSTADRGSEKSSKSCLSFLLTSYSHNISRVPDRYHHHIPKKATTPQICFSRTKCAALSARFLFHSGRDNPRIISTRQKLGVHRFNYYALSEFQVTASANGDTSAAVVGR